MEYNNYEIVKKYFFNEIFQNLSVFYLFVVFILLNFVSLLFIKNNLYLFLVTLFVLIIFFIQIINLPKIVQGSRYLHHFIPLIVILISISYDNIKFLFFKIQLDKLFTSLSYILFILSIFIFFQNFAVKIKSVHFEKTLKNDEMFVSYNKINELEKNKLNPIVCASYYAAIPKKFSNMILKDYQITNLIEVENKDCDYIALDSNATGRYIWFKNSLNDLIIPKFDKISVINQKIGKANILKIQNTVKNLVQRPEYGYNVLFYNKKMIFLKKKPDDYFLTNYFIQKYN